MDMAEQHKQTSRVTRSVDEKIIAGVCGGLSEQFNINAWWFRWSFIILTFFGFAGVFLYVLAWILIPKETEDDSVASGWMEELDFTDIGTIFGVVLIGIAGVIVLNRFFNVSSALIAAGVLGVVGVLLYRGDLRPGNNQQNASADEGDRMPEVEPVDSASSDSADPVSGVGTTVASSVTIKPPRPKKEKRPRPPKSMLGRLTMATALIVLSAMTLVALAGWFRFQPVDYLAVGMGIIALGLLLGAWIGRARWLIAIGILLAPWLFFAALIPSISEWSVGEPSYRPQTIEAVQDVYSLTFGELDIDLTDLSEQDLASIGNIEASVGAGQLDIRVPLGVGILVRAEVGAGTIQSNVSFEEVYAVQLPEVCVSEELDVHQCEELFNGDPLQGEYPWRAYRNDSGIALDRTFSVGTEPLVLELDLSVGAGEIRIQQSGLPIVDSGAEG